VLCIMAATKGRGLRSSGQVAVELLDVLATLFFHFFILATEPFSGFGCALGLLFLEGDGFGFLAFQFFLFGKGVVQFQGAEFVDEADADFAARDGVALAIRGGGFVDDDVLDGGSGEDAAGAGEVKGAGVVEAIEEVGADDLGEEGALSR